jgi:hypothetical protein
MSRLSTLRLGAIAVCGTTTWSRLVARSVGGRVAVERPPSTLTGAQKAAIVAAAARRERVAGVMPRGGRTRALAVSDNLALR